ncbi:MAG TPA: prephenate dehydrogenase [Streptosporangiaceae bacterium]|nr:prephenate dehydrogenase [Streptosporangiaceae bacterium]
MTQGPVPARIVVLGSGLIGTSAALALRRAGAEVWLSDTDPEAAALAAELGAGQLLPATGVPGGPADVAVIAVPPASVAPVLAASQRAGLATCYTDVASVKAQPLVRARDAGCDITAYVPGHPLAGRERSGPAAARADLFLGRTWALCPAPETSPAALATVRDLAAACGAEPVVTDAATHDRWVALISHAPHVVAAALAAQLAPASVPAGALQLAGQGLRDSTRIAVGDTALWRQILTGNAAPVAEVLAAVAGDLAEAARVLTEGDRAGDKELTELLDQGRAGVARIPGKHGGPARAFAGVQVVISDRPGELARLFAAAAAAGVNIEDVGIEHSPGAPVGVAELSVRPEAAGPLITALADAGWPVRR